MALFELRDKLLFLATENFSFFNFCGPQALEASDHSVLGWLGLRGARAVAWAAGSEVREGQGGAGREKMEPGEKPAPASRPAREPAHVPCFCPLRPPAFSGGSLGLVAARVGHQVPPSLQEGRAGEKSVGTVTKLRVSSWLLLGQC